MSEQLKKAKCETKEMEAMNKSLKELLHKKVDEYEDMIGRLRAEKMHLEGQISGELKGFASAKNLKRSTKKMDSQDEDEPKMSVNGGSAALIDTLSEANSRMSFDMDPTKDVPDSMESSKKKPKVGTPLSRMNRSKVKFTFPTVKSL